MKPSGRVLKSRTRPPRLETRCHPVLTTDGGRARLNSHLSSFSLLPSYQTGRQFWKHNPNVKHFTNVLVQSAYISQALAAPVNWKTVRSFKTEKKINHNSWSKFILFTPRVNGDRLCLLSWYHCYAQKYSKGRPNHIVVTTLRKQSTLCVQPTSMTMQTGATEVHVSFATVSNTI